MQKFSETQPARPVAKNETQRPSAIENKTHDPRKSSHAPLCLQSHERQLIELIYILLYIDILVNISWVFFNTNIRITFAFTLDNSKAIGAHACILM